MTGPELESSPLAEARAGTGGRWAATCAALAVSAVLLSAELARGHAPHGTTIQAAKWAAQPSAPLAGFVAAAPANLCPADRLMNPAAGPRVATTPTAETIRRAGRTRCGGRYGP